MVYKFGDKLMIVTLGKETKDPQKKPYKRQNAIKAAELLIDIQAKHSVARINAKGIWILRGSVLSAKKFGTNLPNLEDAFIIGNRYEAVASSMSVCSWP